MEQSDFKDLVVVKRSGQRVEFNGLKIAIAIKRAFDSVQPNSDESKINKVYEDTLKYILDNYRDRKTINVENIQDIIEKILQVDHYNDVYESFSKYRLKRSESRKAFSLKQQHKFVKAIEKIGSLDKDLKKPNELLYEFGKTISYEYAKSYVIDNKYVRAFEEGDLYIHNFGYFNLGYLGDTHLKIDQLLMADTCFNEITELLINAKKEIHGEIAIDHFDLLLDKYILNKYQTLLIKNSERYLALNGYLAFINTKHLEEEIKKLTTFEIKLDDYRHILMSDASLAILKQASLDTYQDIDETLHYNISKLLVTLNNTGKYTINLSGDQTSFVNRVITDEINKLTKLEQVTIIYKLKSPINEAISNLIINNKNIRLVLADDGETYFSTGLRMMDADGKSNVARTSINVARLGLKYHDEAAFKQALLEMLELTKNNLLATFELIGDKSKENYEVLFNNNIADDEKLESGQKIRKVIKSGTLDINLIGLKAAALSLDSEHYEAKLLAIMKLVDNEVTKMSAETKLNFTVSAINDDKASKEFIELDKTIFGLTSKASHYDDLSNTNANTILNLNNIKQYQSLLSGGLTFNIILNKKTNNHKIMELINQLSEAKIGFVNLKVGDQSCE